MGDDAPRDVRDTLGELERRLLELERELRADASRDAAASTAASAPAAQPAPDAEGLGSVTAGPFAAEQPPVGGPPVGQPVAEGPPVGQPTVAGGRAPTPGSAMTPDVEALLGVTRARIEALRSSLEGLSGASDRLRETAQTVVEDHGRALVRLERAAAAAAAAGAATGAPAEVAEPAAPPSPPPTEAPPSAAATHAAAPPTAFPPPAGAPAAAAAQPAAPVEAPPALAAPAQAPPIAAPPAAEPVVWPAFPPTEIPPESTAHEPTQEPAAAETPHEPAQEPAAADTPHEPAQEPAAADTPHEPAQEPAAADTPHEPAQEPAAAETPQEPAERGRRTLPLTLALLALLVAALAAVAVWLAVRGDGSSGEREPAPTPTAILSGFAEPDVGIADSLVVDPAQALADVCAGRAAAALIAFDAGEEPRAPCAGARVVWSAPLDARGIATPISRGGGGRTCASATTLASLEAAQGDERLTDARAAAIAAAAAQARETARAQGQARPAATAAGRAAAVSAAARFDASHRLRLLAIAAQPGDPCVPPTADAMSDGDYPLGRRAALLAAQSAVSTPSVAQAAAAMRVALSGPPPVSATVLGRQ